MGGSGSLNRYDVGVESLPTSWEKQTRPLAGPTCFRTVYDRVMPYVARHNLAPGMVVEVDLDRMNFIRRNPPSPSVRLTIATLVHEADRCTLTFVEPHREVVVHDGQSLNVVSV